MYTKELKIGGYIWAPCIIEEDGRVKLKQISCETKKSNDGDVVHVYRACLVQPNSALNKANRPLWIAASTEDKGIVVFSKRHEPWIALKVMSIGKNCVYASPISGKIDTLRKVMEGELSEREAKEEIKNNRVGLSDLLKENSELHTKMKSMERRLELVENKYQEAIKHRPDVVVVALLKEQYKKVENLLRVKMIDKDKIITETEKLLYFIRRMEL